MTENVFMVSGWYGTLEHKSRPSQIIGRPKLLSFIRLENELQQRLIAVMKPFTSKSKNYGFFRWTMSNFLLVDLLVSDFLSHTGEKQT